VNGKLLRGECFEQVVDPGRSIPEASIQIHGIRPDMVRGQPKLAEVLPAFQAFASDTVLVGHNVAFDMRFLKLKEAATGVRFDQPVLDTLLLASIVHPNEDSHGLEAIAARLGVAVSARHSAAGDALTTAEVFLKLLPLLRARGIVTLGQARAAAEDSYYARLRY
jgi:DNA polymerase-3 subunit epsilon